MTSSSRTPRLIEYPYFLRALQLAIAPAPNDRRGLPAVDGKRFYSSDGVAQLWTKTVPLTDEDAKSLRALMKTYLGKLPPLRTELHLKEAEAFLEVYRELKDRPKWEPVIRSEEASRSLRERRTTISIEQRALLAEAVEEGRIRLFDANRVPQAAYYVKIRSFIPTEDAIAYVESIALKPEDVLKRWVPSDGVEKPTRRDGQKRYPEYIKRIAVELLDLNDHAAGARLLPSTVKGFLTSAKRWKREAAQRQDVRAEPQHDVLHQFGRTIVQDGQKL